MKELDFSGREQLYYQLYTLLFQNIINGKYRIGSLIPAESELMKLYHVSRATARKAVEMLSNEGLVSKKRGYGTVVISTSTIKSPKRVVSYSRKNDVEHIVAIKKVIDNGIIQATKEIAGKLKVEEGINIFRLKRVRYADTIPFYVEINYFVESFVPQIVKRDFSQESLRVALSKEYDIHWSYAQQEIYAILANEEISTLLNVSVGSPLLYIQRVSFDSQDMPREYVSTFYRADQYHLAIELAI